MKFSNSVQLGLGGTAAAGIAVGVVMLVGSVKTPVAAIVPVTQPATAQSVPTPAIIAPALDTFRVEPDGTAIMAGRAAPFAVVDILLNGTSIEQTNADATGSFVAFTQLGYAVDSRAISLMSDVQGTAVASTDTYLIAPLLAPVAVADVPTLAPAIIVASTDGVRVVQSSTSAVVPEVLSSVALDSITYAPSGEVSIAGRASGAGNVRVYIDNQPVTTSRIAVNGAWRVGLPDVDTGVYTLRIDEVGDTGEVISRIETPFQREDPKVVAQAMQTQTQADGFQVAMTTVQPGTTLWAIAQQQFGDGILYVKVFEANRDRIRDPNLIYPGQVFRMPEGDQ